MKHGVARAVHAYVTCTEKKVYDPLNHFCLSAIIKLLSSKLSFTVHNFEQFSDNFSALVFFSLITWPLWSISIANLIGSPTRFRSELGALLQKVNSSLFSDKNIFL